MALACVTLIIALAACRSPLSSDSESSVSPDPRPTRLAVRAVPLEEVRPGGTPKNPPGGTSRGGLPSPEGATVRTFRTVAAFTDPPGDAGVQAPAHADVRKATIDDDRESARVTVEVGGDLPNPLSDGEVQGVGVDFFLGENIESDYQLFADGGGRRVVRLPARPLRLGAITGDHANRWVPNRLRGPLVFDRRLAEGERERLLRLVQAGGSPDQHFLLLRSRP